MQFNNRKCEKELRRRQRFVRYCCYRTVNNVLGHHIVVIPAGNRPFQSYSYRPFSRFSLKNEIFYNPLLSIRPSAASVRYDS